MRNASVKFLIFFSPLVLLVGCKEPEPAKLLRFQNMIFDSASSNEMQVRGEAVLYNPNSFGVRIKEIDIQIEIASTKVATLRETKAVKAGAKKEFVVEFQGLVAMSDIQKIVEKDGLAYLLGKKVPLRFFGNIKTNMSGWSSNIPVDVSEDVSLSSLLNK